MYHNRLKNRVLMIVENCSYLRDPRVRRQAKALKDSGYQVSIINPSSDNVLWGELIDGIRVYQFPGIKFSYGPSGYLLEYAYATFMIAVMTLYVLVVRGFDVVHVANPPDCLVLVTAIYKLIGKKIIFDQHDLSPELYVSKFPRPKRLVLRLLFLLERLSYKLADHTIVTNESYRDIAISRGVQSESKVSVVRNGPEMEHLEERDTDIELRRRSRHLIAFAGTTGYQDGLEYLCRALRSLRFDLGREDFLCFVLGDGDALADVKSLAEELGIDDKIWFAGWVNDPDMYFRYLSTADICVAPEPSNSYNDRSTFLKVTDYMAAGKPIVAFDLPETRFSAGPAALYVCPNNEPAFALRLVELMDDPGLRGAMGEAGRRRIETQFSWQRSIPDLLAVYGVVASEAISRPRPHGLVPKVSAVKRT
jgi:glycosyltransferase involved in cell wall biosynthesis